VLGVSRGLDLGAGAGYLAESLRQSGILMTASEWNDIGINLINDLNPKLPTRKIDVLAFSDPDAWDLIICREVYPFTRVNAFTDQLKIVASLIDSLRSGGVLVLTGSDVAYPHCMNWSLLIDVLKKDHRLSIVSGRHSEAIGRRPTVWMFGYSSYCVMGALLRPFIIMKKMFTRWADIGVIILRKQ
jgi:SAM-dependent methyltransferase